MFRDTAPDRRVTDQQAWGRARGLAAEEVIELAEIGRRAAALIEAETDSHRGG